MTKQSFLIVTLLVCMPAAATSLPAEAPGELTALFFADAIVVGTETGRTALVDRELCATSGSRIACRPDQGTLVEISVERVVIGDPSTRRLIWVRAPVKSGRTVLFLFADRGTDLDHVTFSKTDYFLAYNTQLPASDEAELSLSLAFVLSAGGDLLMTPSEAIEAYAANTL